MKKIVNPFKKFLNNITLGLILLVLAFFVMPIFNANINSNQEVQAEEKTIKIKCYGYEGKNDLGIGEVTIKDSRAFFWQDHEYYYEYNNTIIWFNNPGQEENIARPEKEYKSSNTITASFKKDNRAKVIGYFSDNTFKAGAMLSVGDTLDMSKVTNGATVYCLLSLTPENYKDSTRINVSLNSYINVGSKMWESTYGGDFYTNGSTIKVGEWISFAGNGITNQFDFKVFEGNTQKDIILGNNYLVFLSSDGKVQLIGNSKVSLSSKNSINLNGIYAPTQQNDKLDFDGTNVIFNIYNGDDLDKCAIEVNNSYMHNAIGSSYVVKLMDDIAYTGRIIGIGSQPFKGTFEGNGKTINATVNPFYTYERVMADLYVQLDVNTHFGLFGATDSAMITNIGNLSLSIANHTRERIDSKSTTKINTNSIYVGGSEQSTEDGDNYTVDYYIGGLIGYAANTKVENVNIKATTLNVTMPYVSNSHAAFFSTIYVGGVVAYSYNSNFNAVNVTKTVLNVAREKDEESGNGEKLFVGGFAGYFSGQSNKLAEVTNCKINKSEINIKRTMVTSISMGPGVIVGGFMGNSKYAIISNCGVSGYVDLPDERLLGSDIVGGFIGLTEESNFNVCYAYINLSLSVTPGFSYARRAYIGGFAGEVFSTNNTFDSCEYQGKIELSAVENVGENYLNVGGFLGYVNIPKGCNLNILNSSVVNTRIRINFKPLSESSKAAVGAFIGHLWLSDTINGNKSAVNIKNSSAGYVNIETDNSNTTIDYNFIGRYTNGSNGGVTTTFENNYMFIDYGFAGMIDTGRGLNASGENKGPSETNNDDYNTWTNEPETAIINIGEILSSGKFGFNQYINTRNKRSGSYSGQFLEPSYNQPNSPFALNDKFGYKNVTIELDNSDITESDAFEVGWYKYNKKLYATAVKNYFGTDVNIVLPTVYRDGQACIGYSEQENGFKDYDIGETISANSGNARLTLYPVFNHSVKIKSTMDILTGKTQTDDGLYTVNKRECNDGIYFYEYLITYNGSGEPNFSYDVVSKLLKIEVAAGIYVAYSEDNINLKVTENSGNYKYNNPNELIDAPDDIFELNEGSRDALEKGHEYYANVYQAISLYYGDIADGETTAKYTNTPLTLYRYILNTNNTYIYFNTNELTSSELNDILINEKIAYKSTHCFEGRSDTILNGQNVRTGGELNQKITSRDSSLIYYYLQYTQLGLTIKYYNNENRVSKTVVLYPDEEGTLTITSSNNNLISYFEINNDAIDYSFVGWHDEKGVMYYNDSTINIKELKNESRELNLYPNFVKKNGEKVAINNAPSTNDNFYQISTPEHFIAISYKVNFGGEKDLYFELTQDIDMNGYTNFLPIGLLETNAFAGRFYGNGYSILNLNIHSSKLISTLSKNSENYRNVNYTGLFGYLGGNAQVTSVNLINASVTAVGNATSSLLSKNYIKAGLLTGYATSATISNVLVQGTLNVDVDTVIVYAGGICGQITGNTTIDQCVSKIIVENTLKGLNNDAIAGIVGYAGDKTSSILNCFDLSNVGMNQDYYFGILEEQPTGYNPIQNCYSLNYKVYSGGTDNYNEAKNIVSKAQNNSTHFATFMTKVSSEIWSQDTETNGGYPYLKNTGINVVNYTIDKNLVFTTQDKINFASCEKDENDNYKLTKRYFILDSYDYDDIQGLLLNNGVSFTTLEGFNFTGLTNAMLNRTYNQDSANIQEVFTFKNITYSLNFLNKTMVAEYVNILGDVFATINITFPENNNDLYEISISPIESNAEVYLLGKEFLGYKAFTYLNGGETKYYFTSLDGSSALTTDSNNALLLNNDDQFLITEYGQGTYLGKIYFEIVAENLTYQLQFFESQDKLKDINTAILNDDYFYSVEEEYLTSIQYPEANALVKKGYTFRHWAYLNGEDILEFSESQIPTLERAPFNAERATSGDNEGKYILQLFPYYEANSYEIKYVNQKGGNPIATQTASFDEKLTLLSAEDISTPYGYKIKELKFLSTEFVDSSNEDLHISNDFNLETEITYCYDGTIEVEVIFEKDNFDITIQSAQGVENFDIFYDETDSDTDFITKNLKPRLNDNKYVITSKYLNIINIYIVLNNGVRVNLVTVDGITHYDLEPTLSTFENYYNGLAYLQGLELNVNNSRVIDIQLDIIALTLEENLKKVDNKIQISSAEDLFGYAELVGSGNTDKQIDAVLTNNINITGYKFNMNILMSTIDGQGYSINGFTAFNNETNTMKQNNSFVTNIYSSGSIKNLNFDNLAVSLNNTNTGFALFENNKGTIDNVYILGGKIDATISGQIENEISEDTNTIVTSNIYFSSLVNKNNGIIKNIDNNVEININVKSNDVNVYVAPIVSIVNKGQIENVINNAKVTTAKLNGLTGVNIYTGGIFAVANILDLNNAINKGDIAGINASALGNIISALNNEEIIVKNFVNFANIICLNKTLTKTFIENIILSNDTNLTKIQKSSIKDLKNVTNYQTLIENTTKYFSASNFASMYEYNYMNSAKATYYLKGVNIQIVNVKTRLQNSNSNGVVAKINGVGAGCDNEFIVGIYLNNKTKFNTDQFAKELSNNTFNLEILTNGENSTYCYKDIDTQKDIQVKNIKETFISSQQNIEFNFQAKESEFTYAFELKEDFADEEIEQIKDGFKLFVNGLEREITGFVKSGIIYSAKFSNIQYNDEIKIDINLPIVAKLHETLGVQRFLNSQRNTLVNSKDVRDFTFTDTIKLNGFDNKFDGKGAYTIKAYIERATINLRFDLNKDELYLSEQTKIKYNETFLNTNRKVITSIQGDLLDYMIVPRVEDNAYVAPDIKTTPILNYNHNGINYSFKGFVDLSDNNKIYYDENLNCVIQTLTNDITLTAVWDAVEYTIKVSNDSNNSYFTNINGYTNTSSGAEFNIKFGETMKLPSISKMNYASSFVFNTYNLKANNQNIIENNFNSTNGELLFVDDFNVFDTNYTNISEIANSKIVEIIPIYSEVVYKVNFYSDDVNDGYETYLIHNDFINKPDEINLEFTISNILNESYEIPAGYKAHHDFVGFNKNEELVISYEFNEFKFDKEMFIANKTERINANVTLSNNKYYYDIENPQEYFAVYEIHKMIVTIHNIDFNTNTTLDYNIVDLKGLELFEYDFNSDNTITAYIPYNTRNLDLPILDLIDSNYKFSGYMLTTNGEDLTEYELSYIFTDYILDLYLICDYKINFITKNGIITEDYKIDYDLYENSFGYEFYLQLNEALTLPISEQVDRTGYTLSGFKVDGKDIETFKALKPTSIEFMYTGNFYKIILHSAGAIFPDTVNDNIFTYIDSYTKISDTEAEIQVVYNTLTSNVITELPILSKDGYKFNGYDFDAENEIKITTNGTATAIFEENIYKIEIWNNNALDMTIQKHLDEAIVESYVPSEKEGLTYLGLSLSKDNFVEFTIPQIMPDLYESYSQTTILDNVYTLKVYAYYISNLNVTIEGRSDSKIENTTGLTDFRGGNAFNSSANFKITADNIINKNLTLPVPITQGDLNFASFVGYSTYIEGVKTLVVDESGVLLDNFVYREEITLYQEFINNTYAFNLIADYTSVVNANGFTQNSIGFTKEIVFGEEIGNLPVLSYTGLVFLGYYLDTNTDYIFDNDINAYKLTDENGEILSDDYKELTYKYFSGNSLVDIVAKFDYEYVNITLKSANINLGSVKQIISTTGFNIDNELLSNGLGYVARVPKNTSIIIEANPYLDRANFNSFSLDKTANILDEFNYITSIVNVEEDLVVTVNFDAIEFNITYIVMGEEIDLEPKTYNVESHITLPAFTKQGYTFNGWYLEQNHINKRETINKGTIGDITYFGKLTANIIEVTIHFDNTTNYATTEKIAVNYNNTFENLILAPNVKGYYFVGYFTEQNKQGIKVENNSLCIFTENVDLYAYYEIIPENKLQGYGSEVEPYLINSYEDFKIFEYLLNSDSYNNTNVYYKLTNSITISEYTVINSFKANFNGNDYVIYLDNALIGYNVLNKTGEIIKNVGLFTENSGIISNLILVNNIQELENIDNVTKINFANLAVTNYGQIKNVLVYFNVAVNSAAEINVNNIANSGEILNCACYNSKFIINNIETIVNEDITNFNYLSAQAPRIIDNAYAISTAEELSYLLTLTSLDYEVKLINNIDMKGKLYDKINTNLVLNGNGYVISNLILLDNEYLFNNASLTKIGFENLVFINLYNDNTSLIIESVNFDRCYVQSNVNNLRNVISVNNGNIVNSYFKVKADNVINTNNLNVENIYTTFGELINQNNGTTINAVKFNTESEEIDTFVNEFINIVDSTIWFKDNNLVMDNDKLLGLIGVGNYAYEIVYDSSVLQVEIMPSETKDNLVISKNPINLYIYLDLLNDNYAITNIFVNDIISEIYFDMLFTESLTTKYNEIKIVTEIKKYNVSYLLYGLIDSGFITINDVDYTEYNALIDSGTVLNVSIKENQGYKFIRWSDGSTEKIRQDIIKEDFAVRAIFEQLHCYTLIMAESVEADRINVRWLKDGNDYKIYLTGNEDINDFMPILTKLEYFYSGYSITSNNNIDYVITPTFVPNYKTLNIAYNSEDAIVEVTSKQEFSQNNIDLPILINENGNFLVLVGYDITLKITPQGAYLTKLLVNGNDFILDYSIYENVEQELTFDISITENTDIEIEMEIISLITYFSYDNSIIDLSILNATLTSENYVLIKKGQDLEIKITMKCPDKDIMGFELFDEIGNYLEQIITYDEEKDCYLYTSLVNNSLIKILTKTRTFVVNVYANNGGSIDTNCETFEINETEYNTAFTFDIAYGESFELFLTPSDNYKVKSIIKNQNGLDTLLSIKDYYIFELINSDVNIFIEFSELDTWLTLNEDNSPKYFVIQNFTGNGSKNNPYLIKGFMDFLTIAYNVNILNNDYSNTYFKSVARDMTFNFAEHNFAPINNFNGIIIGDNLSLKGIKIPTGNNIGVFKTLSSSAIIQAINVYGEIKGSSLIGSICGTNNGQIIGVHNFANITSTRNKDSNTSFVGGICAINNGTISRSFNSGIINSSSILTGGICARNNGNVNNVYNDALLASDCAYEENQIIAGLVAENKGSLKFAYNNSRLITRVINTNLSIFGTANNTTGASSDIYYNKNSISSTIDYLNGIEFNDLINKENEIFASWDFEKIWFFENNYMSAPKLNTCYDYLGNIKFVVEFGSGFISQEKLLIMEVFSSSHQTYCLIALNDGSYVLENLVSGTYQIQLTSLLGASIEIVDNITSITLDESQGELVTITIMVSKTNTQGYHGSIIL